MGDRARRLRPVRRLAYARHAGNYTGVAKQSAGVPLWYLPIHGALTA